MLRSFALNFFLGYALKPIFERFQLLCFSLIKCKRFRSETWHETAHIYIVSTEGQ